MNELARLDVMRRDLLGDVRWASGGFSEVNINTPRSPSASEDLRGATTPSDVSDRTPPDGVTRAPRSTLLMREPWEGDPR